MKYFFVLGNNPTLSLAEISAVFGLTNKNQGQFIAPDIFILDINEDIKPSELIKRLGGTIKIGQIHSVVQLNSQAIINKTINLIDEQENPPAGGKGKFKFGISYYGSKNINLKPIGMEIKKYLKEQKISCRWITSKEKTLSSVVVEQNKLTSKGLEIILIPNPQDNKQLLLGQTQAVQPFKELSFRDYGRPARDDRSGMLPPKLAQIMINLSSVQTHCYASHCHASDNASILDPFCGSGTILTEAMLMGYKNLIGSDISKKAVENTKRNISWMKDKFLSSVAPLNGAKEGHIPYSKFHIHERNATELSQIIKPHSVDAIITEPYLGPQRGKIDIKKTVPELERLYSESLTEFNKILKPNSRIVMIWPVFHVIHNTKRITPNFNGFKIINPIPENLRQNKKIILTDRNTIIYGRQDQRVWREIVILEKQN